ncbi:MAG: alpha/beta hydrolase [Veillonella sp.]|nr:alpha/beta hydrolase [Veillonella sp.]
MDISERYFPGFKHLQVEVEPGITINTFVGGEGKEAVLLLHGHPETYLIWRFIAPELAKKYTVVMTDLRGYGDSSKPVGNEDHSNYSNRVMAADQVKVMKSLGFTKFHGVAHDRGARVMHRLVMDWPDEIISCTMMDIVPTLDMYEETNREFATKYWHWFFYIQGGGFPEAALSADPDRFIHYNLQLKIGPTARKQFSEDVLADYTRCFSDPATVHGICEDYRASAGIDLEHDRIDREQGKKIQSPTLLLWGENGVVGRLWDVPAKWRDLIVDMEGHGISDCGHFVPEEQPGQVLEYLLPFLEKYGA